ncbi:MAG: DNA polymerase III subunit gamma/tau [Planctomycetes bacterium]|nr:DNA polymerase III subunit gamma/tau [Planctomycetota bacterium]
MSYLVLARKYRPRTFAEVCEQEVAVKTLQNAITEGRVGHAYLLCGPRGTGKTTTARIFAKALNCERGPTSEPCGTCARCLATDAGSEIDIIEIDAASNRGIDDVRVLRDEVLYAPLNARFKVYIVDEVHMLTSQAFNALLKTLEEPPAHVKFVFATTEAEKVPETIRSRCQILKLTLLREDKIAARLVHVLGQEKIQVAPGVVEEVARLARGSLRDALSITDQLLALSGSAPTIEDVRRLAGAGGPERVEAVLAAVERRDKAAVLESLAGVDGSESMLVEALLEHLRGTLVVLHCGERSQLFQAEDSERERRGARAKRLGSERLELWLFELVGARARMQELSNHARLVLELVLLDLCRMEAALPLAELHDRLLALEERLARGVSAAAPARVPTPARAPIASAPPSVPPPSVASSPAPRPTVAAAATPPSAATPAAPQPSLATRELRPTPPPARVGTLSNAAAWTTLVTELGAADPALGDLLRRTAKLVDVGTANARVQLTKLTDADRELAFADGTRSACETVLARLFGRPLRVVFDDAVRRPPGDRDAFTRSVAELFGGNIEDTP